MTLCVTSWVKCGSETKIPICQANIIYFEPNEKEKHFNFPMKNKADVKLCWSCFASGYQCYSLQQKHAESMENYFHYLWCFQYSFKELDNVEGQNTVFRFGESTYCLTDIGGQDYVSDSYGFVLLSRSSNNFEFYYFDFEREFTCHIKIDFYQTYYTEVRLVKRTIWLLTPRSNFPFQIDAINIANKDKWYHIRSVSNNPISFENVLSNKMIIGNEEQGEYYNCFSSSKVLYLDIDDLVANQTNTREFVDFQKPQQLVKQEKYNVIGVFDSTIILTSVDNPSICYFITYEKLHLKSLRKIDLDFCSVGDDLRISWYHRGKLYFVTEARRMCLVTVANQVVVIDLRTFQVMQILIVPQSFKNNHFHFRCSQDKKTLLLATSENLKVVNGILKYQFYIGPSLREKALNTVANIFNAKEIESAGLPQSLVKEILT